MYIWILLATIMVALSFFNLAPRTDKEHALNEIKAATVVNRFKAEHSARLHTLECEIVYNRNSQSSSGAAGWDGADGNIRRSASGPVEVTDYEPVYTSLKSYLPVGYLTGKKKKDGTGGNYSTSNLRQFVYCLSLDAESDASLKTDSEVFIACDAQDDARTKNIGDHRYLVSVAPIPDRWLTKDGSITPLPTFVNLLSKTHDKTVVFGWLGFDADSGKLKLHGVGSVASRSIKLKNKDHTFDDSYQDTFEQRLDDNYNYKSDLDSKQAGHEKLVAENIILSENSALWRNPVFNDCKATPCMFAYEVFPKTDPACHCYNILKEYYDPDNAGRLTLAECYNDTQHPNIENNTQVNAFTKDTLKDRELRYKKFEDYLK